SEADLRAEAPGQTGDGRKNCSRIAPRADNENHAVGFIEKILIEWKVNNGFYLSAQFVVCGVFGDADDFHRFNISPPRCPADEARLATCGVLSGKGATGQRFVDDDNA